MNTFLATTGSGLMRAERTGSEQWSVEKLLDGQEITCLAANPTYPGAVYAGTRGKGVLYSSDRGTTWLPAGLFDRTVKAISASPAHPGVIYAGTKPALMFVSRDYGNHWEELPAFRKLFSRHFWFSPAEVPFTAYVQGIALSPTDPNVIVVGIEAGAVVRSTDGGKSWEDHRKGALRDCHTITFHASDGSWVYEAGGSGAGTAISSDGGNTYRQNRAGLDRNYGWACAADPIHPEVSYLSASPSPGKAHSEANAQAFIYRRSSEGAWEKLDGGLPQPLNAMPYALVTEPTEPDSVAAGLSNGDVWRSEDRGNSWQRLPFNLTRIHRSMITLP